MYKKCDSSNESTRMYAERSWGIFKRLNIALRNLQLLNGAKSKKPTIDVGTRSARKRRQRYSEGGEEQRTSGWLMENGEKEEKGGWIKTRKVGYIYKRGGEAFVLFGILRLAEAIKTTPSHPTTTIRITTKICFLFPPIQAMNPCNWESCKNR
jgi:hypothetical protein